MENKIGIDVEKAVSLLKINEIVAIPTETVYGLAGNGLSTDAILKIFEAKNRPFFDPLILHFHSISQIENYVSFFPEKLKKIATHFWPGPLTLLLPKNEKINDLVTSGLDRVGVRIPNHSLTLSLLSKLDFPLAAPSANPFGYISPTKATHVADQLHDKVSYILDGGETNIGIESTIVGIENDEVIIYRLGGISVEDIENVIGKTTLKINKSSNPSAPGMLLSHYAPRKPLFLLEVNNIAHFDTSKKFGLLTFSEKYTFENCVKNIVLSTKADDKEAAKNLFAALRELDAENIDCIYAEKLPTKNLGKAINDRLERASAK